MLKKGWAGTLKETTGILTLPGSHAIARTLVLAQPLPAPTPRLLTVWLAQGMEDV